MVEAREIPVGQIEFDEVKIREAQVGTPNFDRLKYSIELEGVQLPILVRPKKDENGNIIPNKYIGIDGCQRHSIMTMLERDTIPARIMDHSEDDCRRLQMILNRNRVPQKKSQELDHVKTFMMHNPNMTQSEVAVAFNMTQADLSNLLGLERLTDEAMGLMNSGRICPTNAIALSRMPAEEQNAHLDQAQEMKTNEFINYTKTEIKKIRAKNRGESTENIVTTILHTKKWFEDILEQLNHEVETTPPDAEDYLFKAGKLEFCKQALSIDEASLAERKEEEERKKKEREEKKKDKKSAQVPPETAEYIKELEARVAALGG